MPADWRVGLSPRRPAPCTQTGIRKRGLGTGVAAAPRPCHWPEREDVCVCACQPTHAHAGRSGFLGDPATVWRRRWELPLDLGGRPPVLLCHLRVSSPTGSGPGPPHPVACSPRPRGRFPIRGGDKALTSSLPTLSLSCSSHAAVLVVQPLRPHLLRHAHVVLSSAAFLSQSGSPHPGVLTCW